MASISGGAKLQAALADLSAKVTKKSEVSIGFFEGSTYPDGTSIPLVAFINEYGRPEKGQPPRPFFRDMIAAKSAEWPKAIGTLLPANGYDAAKVLALAGQGIKDQLQASIRNFDSVPLAPSTIAAKGFDRQLVDTGLMRDSVGFKVD